MAAVSVLSCTVPEWLIWEAGIREAKLLSSALDDSVESFSTETLINPIDVISSTTPTSSCR